MTIRTCPFGSRAVRRTAGTLIGGLLLVAVSASGLLGQQPATSFDVGQRRWRDKSGHHEVLAKLVSYHDRKVTLLRHDGQSIDVPLDQLSAPDIAYVSRQRRVARAQQHRPESKSVSSGETKRGLASPSTSHRKIRGAASERLFGVDWFNSDAALAAAQQEQKPILWFRVLGDLSGFM